VEALDPAELLAAYDSQLRARVPTKRPPGVEYEWDGPLLRFTGFGDQGWVLYRDLDGFEGAALDEAAFKTRAADFGAALTKALADAGYPAKADPAAINAPMLLLLLTILVIYVTMVYGPIAAWLVELFPTRIRYTSMSLPYHIGNGWFGGFLPTTAFAIVALTGNIYSGLWYPVIVALVTVIVGTLFLPETKDVDISK